MVTKYSQYHLYFAGYISTLSDSRTKDVQNGDTSQCHFRSHELYDVRII